MKKLGKYILAEWEKTAALVAVLFLASVVSVWYRGEDVAVERRFANRSVPSRRSLLKQDRAFDFLAPLPEGNFTKSHPFYLAYKKVPFTWWDKEKKKPPKEKKVTKKPEKDEPEASPNKKKTPDKTPEKKTVKDGKDKPEKKVTKTKPEQKEPEKPSKKTGNGKKPKKKKPEPKPKPMVVEYLGYMGMENSRSESQVLVIVRHGNKTGKKFVSVGGHIGDYEIDALDEDVLELIGPDGDRRVIQFKQPKELKTE